MRANWVSRVQNSQQISLGYEWIGCRQQTDNQHRVVVDVVRKDRKRELALSCEVQAASEARTVRWLEAVRVIMLYHHLGHRRRVNMYTVEG